PRVTLEQLTNCFIPRMNPPDPRTTSFDPQILQQETNRANAIPNPSPPSAFPSFNSVICEDDITTIKSYLKCTAHSDSTGADLITYSIVQDIDNDRLASFFDRAFQLKEFPTFCILKFASLLLHLKLSEALEEAHILPASQNGFRAGYRTNNNIFILRTLIEKAKSLGDPLYVAFVDISNAFPSMNQSSLWNKLADHQLTGKYFD
ncbi:hypothetical protein EV368DRAFT_19911, partial [Lentinula lateritia]